MDHQLLVIFFKSAPPVSDCTLDPRVRQGHILSSQMFIGPWHSLPTLTFHALNFCILSLEAFCWHWAGETGVEAVAVLVPDKEEAVVVEGVAESVTLVSVRLQAFHEDRGCQESSPAAQPQQPQDRSSPSPPPQRQHLLQM
ncbi:hypothetical protein BSKO_11891 [Bryopsis sp. KO-2023]|nr:hypothetical protein BSKO_11891 [Bryopsis sp. KO-2023]